MRVLIFGTIYTATPDRVRLARQWLEMSRSLNPDNDLLLVDSASPLPISMAKLFCDRVWWWSFSDNIGHLSHGGRDGWGRAFCHGLQAAIEGGYDYAVHIEGDSLLRKPVMPIVEQMARDGIKVASVPIGYGEAQRSTWVETGLMFFDVAWLKQSNFIAGYDWQNRTAKPEPEIVIRKLLGNDLVMLPLKAERSDKGEISVANVTQYDWITHCAPEVYDAFVAAAMEPA